MSQNIFTILIHLKKFLHEQTKRQLISGIFISVMPIYMQKKYKFFFMLGNVTRNNK